MKNVRKICLSAIVLIAVACSSSTVMSMPNGWTKKLMEELEEQQRRMEEARRRKEAEALRQEGIKADAQSRLNGLRARGITSGDEFAQAQKDLAQSSRYLKNHDRYADVENEAGKMLLGMGNDFFKFSLNQAQSGQKLAEAKAIARENAKASIMNHRHTIEQLKDPKTLAKAIATLTAVSLGATGAFYTAKFGYNYLMARMDRPKLVRESSRHGFMLSLKQMFGIELPQEVSLADIVLEPKIEKAAHVLANDISVMREYSFPFKNMLFYGPPGTGKTAFARILSRYAGMDYAILSGADFSQFKGGDAVKELHALFDWAEQSEHGLLIFIDEADACLRDRSTLDKDGVNFVNAFLSRTGDSSDKFSLVMATNYPEELDQAVRSRIHVKLPFELPGYTERVKIINKKLAKHVLNKVIKRKVKDGGTQDITITLANDVDAEFIKGIARRIDGFSGRDIDQFASALCVAACRGGDAVVTQTVFNQVVDEKIEQIAKDKETTEYQRQRAQAARKKNAAAA